MVVTLAITAVLAGTPDTGKKMNEEFLIIDQLLPYNDNLEKRDTASIEIVVLHSTELPTMEMAREYGEKIHYKGSRTGNSGHYYIDRDGTVYRYVTDDRTAHHVVGYNARSIGIEIVNNGRYPDWFHSTNQRPTEKYTGAQIESLKKLLRYLKKQYPGISELTRHSELDTGKIKAEDNPAVLIRRKIDPGPLFPWQDILSEWHRLNQINN